MPQFNHSHTTIRRLKPITVLIIPDVGRFDWDWGLLTLDFFPKGKRRPFNSWPIQHNKNTWEFAFKKACRIAAGLQKTPSAEFLDKHYTGLA